MYIWALHAGLVPWDAIRGCLILLEYSYRQLVVSNYVDTVWIYVIVISFKNYLTGQWLDRKYLGRETEIAGKKGSVRGVASRHVILIKKNTKSCSKA